MKSLFLASNSSDPLYRSSNKEPKPDPTIRKRTKTKKWWFCPGAATWLLGKTRYDDAHMIGDSAISPFRLLLYVFLLPIWRGASDKLRRRKQKPKQKARSRIWEAKLSREWKWNWEGESSSLHSSSSSTWFCFVYMPGQLGTNQHQVHASFPSIDTPISCSVYCKQKRETVMWP
jgi:hypothetical protein